MRIIQRFGRIDRIGSPNERIQLVNFWPNMELEEYINLEQRVSGRMVLLDISATGEENLIEQQSGNQMNDLEYRRKQLLKLQDAVIDLEDLSTGVSIADLTLTDFRIDLARVPQGASGRAGEPAARHLRGHHARAEADDRRPASSSACAPRATPPAQALEPGYPLGAALPRACRRRRRGAAALHAGQAGSRPSQAALHRARPARCRRLRPLRQGNQAGRGHAHAQRLLAAAVASVVGKKEERAVASLFTPGGTHAMKGEFAGINDFEVVAFLVVLPERRRHERSRRSDRSPRPARASARVDQRVPKKLLVENGAPTAADKRSIKDGIEELRLAGRAQAHHDRRARVSRRRASATRGMCLLR